MSDIAIKVEKLGKLYQIGQIVGYNTLRESLTNVITTPFHNIRRIIYGRGGKAVLGRTSSVSSSSKYIWALKDVSFEIRSGEAVGIIGRNGSGKTTLLKILSRITAPTEGLAEIHGRIGSLLEVGTGFHPELTGRENIYLNGAVLGMNRTEVARKFDEIVAFAEIEKFLDTPVKRYSSGMYVRLAFAVAAHLEPDILLVDEVLAVGDAAFQKKCLGKMDDVTKKGRTVLFVSHNMASIEALCESVCLLDQGRLVIKGKTDDMVQHYLSSLQRLSTQPLSQRPDRQGNRKLLFTEILFYPVNGTPADMVKCGQDLEILVGYESNENTLQRVSMSLGIFTLNGQCMLVLNNEMVGTNFDLIPPYGQFSCRVKRFPLAPGKYYLNLYCTVNGIIADWVQQAAYLTVESGDFFGTGRLPPQTHGGMLVPQDWCIKTSQREAQNTPL